MYRHFFALLVFATALSATACGSDSQAVLDCEEYDRLVQHLGSELRKIGNDVDVRQMSPDTCEQWVEQTSTRCQQVFYSLAQCSRSYDSKPRLTRQQCISELLEVDSACMVPEDLLD